MHPRPALSRVEVLLVLFIAVLVVGMVVAATGRLRDEANRVTCRDNLRQIGISLHNHYDQLGKLPPLTDQGEGAPTGRGLPSVFANLIPYVEATAVVFRLERSVDYYHAPSSVVFTFPHKGNPYTQVGGMANGVMQLFLDPADGTADRLRDVPMTLPDGTTGYYATGSYAANGLVPWAIGVIPQSFPRGTKHTILFGERPQVCRTAAGDEVYNLWGVGFYSPHMPAFAALTPASPPGLWSTGQVTPAEPLPDEGAADRDALVQVRVGRRDAAPVLPDFPTPVQIIRRGRSCDPRLPGSPHHEGMQVVMADASVQVFGPETSSWVFWAACTLGGPLDGP